jgi:kumamolisin
MPQHLSGSEREPLPGATALRDADPTERLEVTVLLNRPHADDLRARADSAGTSPHLTREAFAAKYSAHAADITAVENFAKHAGLTVVQTDPAARRVILSGTVAAFSKAFGVHLRVYSYKGGTYRGREGAIQLPDSLSGKVEAVLGLDNRPQAQPRFRVSRSPRSSPLSVPHGTTASYTPLQVAAAYSFPAQTGAGQCIALIELGGGFRPDDLSTYFSGLSVNPMPDVIAVSVDHASNAPTGDANGPDGEVMLDIEVAGSIAPGAKIAVYFTPNTDAGFLNAVSAAIHDTTNKPSVISISWGGAESTWTNQAMTAMDEAFQAAAALGITVCVASGDSGSSDGVNDGKPHVDFPASSPHALACGGTSLKASGTTITAETVWNDGTTGGESGGGVSAFFKVPSFQSGCTVTPTKGSPSKLTMRGVPDVAGDADPNTGYQVRVDGQNQVYGGTSAVAPLWAALIARINSAGSNAQVGYINARLYASDPCNDITVGNNGAYEASKGWDACTGLGSPNGTKVAKTLAAQLVGAK